MKQVRLSDLSDDASQVQTPEFLNGENITLPMLDTDIAEIKRTYFWEILVETVKRNPLYPNIAGYAWDNVLNKDPSITPKQLASLLSISLGEAMVIIDEFFTLHDH